MVSGAAAEGDVAVDLDEVADPQDARAGDLDARGGGGPDLSGVEEDRDRRASDLDGLVDGAAGGVVLDADGDVPRERGGRRRSRSR